MPWLKPWTDKQMDVAIAVILRTGVILAAVTVLVGAFFYLRHYGHHHPDYRVFMGEPADLCSIPGIVNDALAVNSGGIIQLGLLLLIATPIVRVGLRGRGLRAPAGPGLRHRHPHRAGGAVVQSPGWRPGA